MFFLLGSNSGFVIHKKGTNTIGRVAGDIVIKDSSVSRKHAEIEVKDDVAFLRDCNSKYFTKYNERLILGNEEIKLEDGSQITFGEVKFKFHVGERLIVCSTGAKEREQTIETLVKQLGGEKIKEWNTTCTHLTTSEILITLKVLHAIQDNKRIVTPEYWAVYLKNITSGQMPPDASQFYPPLGENIINSSYVKYNPGRNTVFKGKTFAFWSKKKQSKIESIITKAGGVCISLCGMSDENQLLKLMDKYIVMDPEDPIVEQKFSKVFENYKRKGKRTIPVQEVVLAILQCCCDENCNPSFDRAKAVFTKETQKHSTSRQIVPETESEQFNVEVNVKPTIIQATMEQDVSIAVSCRVEESVAGTSHKYQSVMEETQLPAKRIKLDPEIVIRKSIEMPAHRDEVSAKKNADSAFKRMMKETSPPPAKRSKKGGFINPFAQIASPPRDNPHSIIAKEENDDLDLTDNPFGQPNLPNLVDVKPDITEDVEILQDSISNRSTNQPTSGKRVTGVKSKTPVKSALKSGKKPTKAFMEHININYSEITHDISGGEWLNNSSSTNQKSNCPSQDEEERKWCEKFNNSVVIVVKDLLRKDRIDQGNSQVPSNQTSVKNFKKFRKVPVPKSGIMIKCSRSVFGGSNLNVDYGCSEDEDNRDI